jgi:phosphoribosyl 1,2-cyclic phosphate phosphodiesterase
MPVVTVLGCGGSAGVPQIGGADGRGDWGVCDPTETRNRRTRSSIVIEGPGGERLLVDTSPDLRQQLLDCGVPKVEAVLFTHPHADHILGLDEVRILNRLIDRPLPAYADAATREELGRRFDYAFRPWQPPGFFRPVLELATVAPGDVLAVAGMDVRIFEQDHGFIRTLGLRIGNFAYCTDVCRFDDAAMAVLQGVEIFMIDCFQRQAHRTHGSMAQVMAWREALKPRQTILTHMGFDMDFTELTRTLPPDVVCAWDGMTIPIG